MDTLVYSGKLLKVYKRALTLPNGHRTALEVIRHPGAALIVPMLSKDKVILLRQFRSAAGGYIYELPAGTIGKGESALACAKREIIEETGYRGRSFVRLGHIFPVPGYSTEKIVIFKATGLVKTVAAVEADEVISSFAVSRSRLRRLFRSRKIVDAKTICALAMCGWL